MLKHWEHTEYVNNEELQALKKGKAIIPSVSIPANTAVYVCGHDTKRLEGIYDPELKGIRQLTDKSAPNRDLRLYKDAIANKNITILAVNGLMGTGKTSTAVEELINKHLNDVKAHNGMLREPNRGQHKLLIAQAACRSGWRY